MRPKPALLPTPSAVPAVEPEAPPPARVTVRAGLQSVAPAGGAEGEATLEKNRVPVAEGLGTAEKEGGAEREGGAEKAGETEAEPEEDQA